MKKITFALKPLILIFAIAAFNNGYAQDSRASYTITFTSTWDTETNDPVNGNSTAALPGNAHWSNLVGATHKGSVALLEMGSLATVGVKNVAELGDNNAIMSEVQSLITAGTADQFLQMPFDSFAPRTFATLMNIEVDENFPFLSVLSMIAPSPDWMIAVNSINLRDGNSWVQSLTIPMFPYDAGTDSGINYTSGNQPTVPAQPITSLINIAPFNDKPIGTLTITFNQTLNVSEQELSQVRLFPNPSNGLLNITTTASNILSKAFVYDVLGKQVAKFDNNNSNQQLQFDLANLKTGIYLVRLALQDGSSITKKIVLN
nr:spondin domain-containing protein [uncultured Psychroserpens sp.]